MLRPTTALAVLALLLTGLTACGTRSGETGGTNPDVPASAEPGAVVNAYLVALQERDESDAVALTIRAYSWGDRWSYEPPVINSFEIGASSPDVLIGPTQNQWDDAVTVPVTVDLSQDEELADGSTDLTFTLWRGRVNDRWLIAGLVATTPMGDVILS